MIFQAIASIAITLLQFTLVNSLADNSNNGHTIDLSSDTLRILLPTTSNFESQEPSILLTVLAWATLITASLLLLIHTARLSSKLLRYTVTKYWGRVTAKKLFVAKMSVLVLSLAIIMASSLLIPAILIIVPLNIAFTAIGAICFIAQHAIYRHNKTPVRQMI